MRLGGATADENSLFSGQVFDANERWYFKQEMILMLEKVGFGGIEVKGNWREEDFAEPHYSMVFAARK